MRRPVSIPAPPPIPALSPLANVASAAAAPPPEIDDDDLAKTLPIAPAARLPMTAQPSWSQPSSPSRPRPEPLTPTPPPSVPALDEERAASRPSSPGDEGPGELVEEALAPHAEDPR
jgi:hypothetical protein